MASRAHHINVDCADPSALAAFWAQVTGFEEDPEDPNRPGDEEAFLAGRDGHPNLLFTKVPEGKAGKNRVHLDLWPVDRTRDEEVERVLGLGATLLDDRRRPDGTGWVVFADPEGNEFCVERGAAERGTAS